MEKGGNGSMASSGRNRGLWPGGIENG
jgi:hypothetical protein